MSKDKLNAVIAEKIVEPVPTGGRLNDCLVRSGQRVKVIENTFIVILDALSFDDTAVFVDSGYLTIIYMQIFS